MRSFFGLPQSSGLDLVSEEMLLRFAQGELQEIRPNGTEAHKAESPSAEVRDGAGVPRGR